jgi:predicted double-glycine peptidase
VSLAALVIQLMLVQAPAHALLDVPFMSQTPELCGGAAVSMVFRYWGQGDVFPQDFAPLVSASDGGIFTGALAKAVSDRGWHALVEQATAGTARTRIHAEIDRGRPVIALIEVAPRVYHYVVIVGSTDAEIIFHDPARSAFRVSAWTDFDRAWAATDRWMMVAVPASAPGGATARLTPTTVTTPTSVITTPCAPLVKHAVDAAIAGQTDDAERELAAAMRLCPTDASAYRETAGLRFTQKRWADANQLATTAVRLSPADAYSWEMAATSRYLMGNTIDALSAWNRIGEPRADVITVHGAGRTRVPVIASAAGLPPRALITASTFMRSLRRVRDVPSIAAADIKLEPIAGGLANVDIAVVERPVWPSGTTGLLMLAARPVLQREVRVDVAGLSGEGEAAYVSWRYAEHRPRVAAGLAFPSPRWLPGITSFSAMWEEQNYAMLPAGNPALLRETRRRAGIDVADWASGWLKWQAGGALDRFDDAGFAAANASLLARLPGDRMALSASAESWSPLSNGSRFATMAVRAAVRSTTDLRRPMVSASAAFQRASTDAPLAVWPSAGGGTGTERAATLRGHQLVEDGVVKGDVLGRRLLSGTIEYAHPVANVRAMNVALAGFVDAARATLPRDGFATPPAYVDGGVGLRVRLPGTLGGVRLDVAHRFGTGRTIYSAGWLASWPH